MNATKPGVNHDVDQGDGELDVFVFEPANALAPTSTWPTNGQFLEWATRYVDVDGVECDRAALAAVGVAAEVARRLVALGYCVYDGVNYFCIYPNGHCS